MAPDDDRAGLRASDQDRHQVAEQLHTAAAEGRLSLDELAERLDTLYAARTYGELVPLTRDLPVEGPAAPAHPAIVSSAPGAPAVRGPSTSIGILGASERAGEWVVPETHTAVAMMGAVVLDLSTARFAAARVTITAVAIMGGIEVIVPPDLSVEVDGIGFMGAFDRKGAGIRSDGPTVRITGFAMMGAVEVKRAARRKELDPGSG